MITEKIFEKKFLKKHLVLDSSKISKLLCDLIINLQSHNPIYGSGVSQRIEVSWYLKEGVTIIPFNLDMEWDKVYFHVIESFLNEEGEDSIKIKGHFRMHSSDLMNLKEKIYPTETKT